MQSSKPEAFLTFWKNNAIAPSVCLILCLPKQSYGYEMLKAYAIATSLTSMLPLFHWVDLNEVSDLASSLYEISLFKVNPTFFSNYWPKTDLWSNFSRSEISKKSFDKSLLETKVIESFFPLGYS